MIFIMKKSKLIQTVDPQQKVHSFDVLYFYNLDLTDFQIFSMLELKDY